MKRLLKPSLLFFSPLLVFAMATVAEPLGDSEVLVAENQLPVFKTVGTLQSKETEILSHQLSASDKDGDVLIFSLINGPDNLRVSSDGLLQWNPSFDDAGEHAFTVAVSDGQERVNSSGSIKVLNTNRSPVFDSEAVTQGRENEHYEYSINTSDDDDDLLSLLLKQAPEGMILKANVLSWQPSFNQAGNHDVVVVVSDAEVEVEQRYRLKIKNNNRPPVWKPLLIAPLKEGERFTLPLMATDSDGDRLSFSIATGPSDMALDSQDVLNWSPDYESAGRHTLELLVSDGEQAVSQSLTLNVIAVNRAPTFTSKPVTLTAEAQEYNYLLKVSDPDTDDIKMNIKKSPKGLVLTAGQLHWLPSYKQAGQHSVVIQASDGQLSAEQAFNISVSNTNRAPEWQVKALPEGKESADYSVILSAVDADGDELSYELVSGPEAMQVSDAGVIQWQPGFETAGAHQVKLVANDGESKTPVSLAVNIENTNRAPEFSALPPLMAAENMAWKYKLKPQDADGDQLITSMLKGPSGMVLQDGMLQWLPSYEQSGAYSVILEAADMEVKVQQTFTLEVSNTNRKPEFVLPESALLNMAEADKWQLVLKATDADGEKIELGLSAAPKGVKLQGNTLQWVPGYLQSGSGKIRISASDAESVTYMILDVNVANTNRAPEINSAAVLTAKEGQAYEYELLAVDADIVEDMNSNNRISYKIIQGPEGMKFLSHRLQWKPSFEQAGEHVIKVEVSDGSLAVEQVFSVMVENTNRAPIFDSEPFTSVLEGVIFEYEIDAVDQDGDSVQLTLESAPEGMTLEGRILTWKPGFFSAGEYAIIIKSSDGRLDTMQSFDLMVANNNRLPVFESKPKKVAHENVNYKYSIKVTDKDKEDLGLALLSGPEGMSLTPNGLVSWRPAFHQKGDHAVSISASDGSDIVYQSYTVTVVDTNREPTLVKIAEQSVIADDKFRYQIQASDVDGDELTYRLIHGPKSIEINQKGRLYWRPNDNDVGTHKVIISVSDGDLKVRKHFNIRVLEETH